MPKIEISYADPVIDDLTGYAAHDEAMTEMTALEREFILGFKACWDEYVEMNADGYSLSETAAKLRENILNKVGKPIGRLSHVMDEFTDCLSAGGGFHTCNHDHEGATK